MYVLSILILLILIYLWCLKGRTNHPDIAKLRNWNYAHRGLHDAHRPENSLSAFQAALDHGYGIELDLHLTKDGDLAVIHDSSLKRTAGSDVVVESLTVDELKNYALLGSNEPIPMFSQVLQLYEGKAPLIVELKPMNNNHVALCEAACKQLDEYNGLYCIESFDPRCIRWLRKNRPELIRGQLSENWLKTKSKMPWIVKVIMTYHISNVYTRPDFIAYKYADRKTFGTQICRKLWKIQGVSWTLRNMEDHQTATAEDWIPIFENFTV